MRSARMASLRRRRLRSEANIHMVAELFLVAGTFSALVAGTLFSVGPMRWWAITWIGPFRFVVGLGTMCESLTVALADPPTRHREESNP